MHTHIHYSKKEKTAVGVLICDENQTPDDMQGAQGKQIFKTVRRRAAECNALGRIFLNVPACWCSQGVCYVIHFYQGIQVEKLYEVSCWSCLSNCFK